LNELLAPICGKQLPNPWATLALPLCNVTALQISAIIDTRIAAGQMTNSDIVEVIVAVIGMTASEVPAISIVYHEQDWARRIKHVAANDDSQIRWRECHGR
jgi:hypothetical protein